MTRSNQCRTVVLSLTACLLVAANLIHPRPAQMAGKRESGQNQTAPAVRSEMIVSTAWLAAHLADPKVVVLHVARERAGYDAGHIPGARFLGWTELVATREGVANELPPVAELQKLFAGLGVSDDSRVVLYGDNAGLAAARAYFTLDYLGHGAQASLLDGGWEKWQAEQRSMSKETPTVRPGDFTPRVQASSIAGFDVVRDLSWVTSNVASPEVTLVDARPADDYRAGHIPGATNIFWMEHLVSKEHPVLRPAAELRQMYEAAGATRGQKVVAYCRTGVQASHAYFIAKYLGYDAVIYDGSFSEWSQKPGAPVATGDKRK